MASIASGFIVANVAMRGFNMAVGAAKNSLIDYNAKMEQAQIGFTTLLGSADQATTFVKQLQVFAAKTPFDFPGLQSASNTMVAMGFAAQDVIPTLTAVGDLVAAVGKSGGEASATINRIVYNLGQMKSLGRLTGRDVRDLAMLGVPVQKILAKGFHVSTAEMQNMISKGTVPADKAIQLLIDGIENSNMGGMMAEQAKTFNGAMSTIQDSVPMIMGTALKPLFDMIRDITYAFANWISSDDAMAFAQKLQSAVRALVILFERAGPAVENFGRGIMNAVKNGWASIQTFFNSLQTRIKNQARDMYVGGWNTMVAYAKGMIESAHIYVEAAVGYIADYISAFLVGQSPPKMGPLSKIYDGGRNTIEAWVDGAMAADLSRIVDLPKQITKNLKVLDKGAEYIQNQLKGLDSQLGLIDLNMSRIQLNVDRLTYAYQQQIEPIQKQYDILMDTYSLTDKKRDLELALQKNQLQQQYNAAKGDWWAQAKIKAQMDSIDQQMEANRLLEEQQSLEAQLAGIPLEEQMKGLTDEYNDAVDPLQKQLDIMTMQRSELEYQRSIWAYISDDISKTSTAMKTAATSLKGASGGGIGAKAKAAIAGKEPKEVKSNIKVDEELIASQAKIEEAAQAMADTFINSFTNYLSDRWPTLLGAAIGAVVGSVVPGLGTVWGAAIGGTIGTLFSDDIKGAVSDGLKELQKFLGGSGPGGFKLTMPSLEQIVDLVSDAFQMAFDWIIYDGVPGIANALRPMADAVISFIPEALTQIYENLPTITGAIIDFIATNAPILVAKLGEWAFAFTAWILTDALPRLLEKLPALGVAILKYIVKLTGQMVTGAVKMGTGFIRELISWLQKLPGKVWDEFSKVTRKIGTWISEILPKATSAGSDFVGNIMDEIGKLPGRVAGILGDVIGKITSFIAKGPAEWGRLARVWGRGFANGISNLMENAINTVIRGINSFKISFPGIDLGPLGKIGGIHWGGLGLSLVHLPNFATGAWGLPRDMVAQLHQGESIIRSDLSEKLERALDKGGNLSGARGVVVNGPLVNIETFTGSESEVDNLMDRIALELRLSER